MGVRVTWFAAAFLVLCGGSVLLPGIDLWVSALFYRPADGFFLGDWVVFRAIRDGLPYVVVIFVVALSALLVLALLRRRTILGLDGRAALFLLLALALGPGLTVNTIFKDHWGRARPAQIVEFGGDKQFSRAFVPSDQCARNCSFTAGDPSIGFYLVSIAFLATAPRRRRWGVAGAVVLGAALGVVRIAQGGHFLSDVIASGFLVYGVSGLLHRALIVHDGIGTLLAACRKPSIDLQRFAALSVATLAFFFFCYTQLDEPLAHYFHDSNPVLQRVFRIITQFGEGGVYLVPLGLVIIASHYSGRARLAWRAGYVFAAVALPGIIADIAKPVFGRARPALLFQDQIFGFTWHGAHASQWSFPSGHAVTITALATALYALYPPLWPAYLLVALLVAASRIIIDAHYLSDVIAGAYIGFAFAWALTIAAKRNNVELALQSPKITDRA
jgi:lipid A 4'-phosphatase